VNVNVNVNFNEPDRVNSPTVYVKAKFKCPGAGKVEMSGFGFQVLLLK